MPVAPLVTALRRRRARSSVVLATACLTGLTLLAAAPASTVEGDPVPPPVTYAKAIPSGVPATTGKLPAAPAGTVRITQANLLSGQADRKFAADLAAVHRNGPDFVTYNEVPYRADRLLAPPGYALWRTPGKYKGANAVAWRTDRWTAIASGTTTLTLRWGKTKKQKVHWGVRYANWATLRGVDGRVVSVVSAHFPPKHRLTKGLTPVAVRNLGALVSTLRNAGPVLVGGDLNFHYTNRREYPAALLAEQRLTPTYDVLGTFPVTGDHRGATVDYLMLSDAPQFAVHAQYTTELNSDHDAVTADVGLTGGAPGGVTSFSPGVVVNDPSGPLASRRAVLDLLVKAVDGAPPKAGIHLQTAGLADKRLFQALRRASKRGVEVQFLTRRERPNVKERKLFAKLGHRTGSRVWAVPCWKKCQAVDARKALPPTQLLVSRSGITDAVRIETDTAASYANATSAMSARVRTGTAAYDWGFRGFLRLVGRTY